MKGFINKNTRARKYNHKTREQWAKKSSKLSADIANYLDIALEQHHFNKLIDFSLLNKALEHLDEVSKNVARD